MNMNRDKIIQRIEAGECLASLRNKKGMSLVTLAGQLGISPTYLNEIEKGHKTPADELIRNIAAYYGIHEADLFQRFGKIPLSVTEFLKDFPELQSILARIESDNKLSREDKYDFVEEIEHLYMKYLKKAKATPIIEK